MMPYFCYHPSRTLTLVLLCTSLCRHIRHVYQRNKALERVGAYQLKAVCNSCSLEQLIQVAHNSKFSCIVSVLAMAARIEKCISLFTFFSIDCFSLLPSANAIFIAASAMHGNGTSSPDTDQKVQISVKSANGNVCLYGSGESLVLEHFACNVLQDFDWKPSSEAQMILRQNTRILRSDTTFAEVAIPAEKSHKIFPFRRHSSVKVFILKGNIGNMFTGLSSRKLLSGISTCNIRRSLVHYLPPSQH